MDDGPSDPPKSDSLPIAPPASRPSRSSSSARRLCSSCQSSSVTEARESGWLFHDKDSAEDEALLP